jgi:hypothetical protein
MFKATIFKTVCCCLAPVLAASLASAQTIVYVTPAGGGLQNGTSWSNAVAGSQFRAKLAAASSNTQFWVAKGTYYPTATTTRTLSFAIPSNVSVYGGFSGTETLLSQRDPSANPTILNGDIGVTGNYTDNSQHVVTVASSTVVVDGFSILNGYADGGGADGYGGGIYTNGNNIFLSNLIVKNNIAQFGGGIFNNAGSLFLSNNLLEANTTYGGGGGLNSMGVTVMDNCVFNGNIAKSADGLLGTGGAFQCESNTSLCTNCIIVNNAAGGSNDDGGGAVMLYGGIVNMINCTVYGNSTASSYNTTANSISIQPGALVNLTNTIIWGNATGHVRNGGLINYLFSLVKDVALLPPNLNSSPQFNNTADLIGPDGKWGTSDDGLMIGMGSPAVDAGTPTGTPVIDITGLLRPQGLAMDMGAYELMNVPLPVSFLYIKARQNNQGVQVDWELGVESGISHYEIEKAVDGRNFRRIGSVSFDAARNKRYSWMYNQAPGDENYYRVKAVEMYGSYKYSPIVKLSAAATKPGLLVYPNPVHNNSVTVALSGLPPGMYFLQLLNSAGQQVLLQQLDYGGGTVSLPLSLKSSWPKGIYYLQLKGMGDGFVQQLQIN